VDFSPKEHRAGMITDYWLLVTSVMRCIIRDTVGPETENDSKTEFLVFLAN
jgi:hypothetical protein